jgi:hypothetical protein
MGHGYGYQWIWVWVRLWHTCTHTHTHHMDMWVSHGYLGAAKASTMGIYGYLRVAKFQFTIQFRALCYNLNWNSNVNAYLP